MKQLSSSELNSMSKEELAAMVLQMQQLHQQLQQQQKEMELQQKKMEQQIHTLNEKIAIMNACISAAPRKNWRLCRVR